MKKLLLLALVMSLQLRASGDAVQPTYVITEQNQKVVPLPVKQFVRAPEFDLPGQTFLQAWRVPSGRIWYFRAPSTNGERGCQQKYFGKDRKYSWSINYNDYAAVNSCTKLNLESPGRSAWTELGKDFGYGSSQGYSMPQMLKGRKFWVRTDGASWYLRAMFFDGDLGSIHWASSDDDEHEYVCVRPLEK